MVLEALAAVGLAANVVQFIQFGCQLVSLMSDIKHSADGLAPRHSDLGAIAKALEEHSKKLKSTSLPEGDAVAVLAERSALVANQLLHTIKNIGGKKPGSTPEHWASFCQAVKTIWKHDKISSLDLRMKNLRDQMILHLLSETAFETREHQVRTETSLNELQTGQAHSDLRLSHQLADIMKNLSAIGERFSGIQSPISLTELEHSFSRFSVDFERIAVRKSIQESLLFDSMTMRHTKIPDAHRRTFDWIWLTESLPVEDHRSKIELSSWLEHGKGIYWITGKPGSGKSTLMKYLDDHKSTNRLLQAWAQSSRLVTASFYFWNPGTSMQKTLLGLLQSLLYYILSRCPDLVEVLCPKRWSAGQISAAASGPWSVSELRHSLDLLKTQEKVSARFYFHIDGLDEYEGDHYEVIRTIQGLAESPAFKLCVSSRPWNCFQDALGGSNERTLQLHELTEKDIELFAHENVLQHNRRFKNAFQEQEYVQLVHEIRRRAQGVFLWVRLVVHSLREGLANEDQISLLRERLEELPTDLEPFFEHILNSVHKVYRERMASTFLAALQVTEPLKITHYFFLDEEDPEVGMQMPFKPLNEVEIMEAIETTQRRLNGRYKGLLEPSSTQYLTTRTTVDFLHRTLRDFLKTPKMESFFESRLADGASVSASIVRALLAETTLVNKSVVPRDFEPALRLANQVSTEMADASYEHSIIDCIEYACHQLWSCSEPLEDAPPSFMTDIAIHIGRIDYVEHRVKQKPCVTDLDSMLMHALLCSSARTLTFATIFDTDRNGIDSALIDYTSDRFCLRREAEHEKNIAPLSNLVQVLLERGADPNGVVLGIPVWFAFLELLLRGSRITHHQEWWRIFQLMVSHGADIRQQAPILSCLAGSAEQLDDEQLHELIRGFSPFLDQGLDPNFNCGRNSIWIEFMFSVGNRRSNVTIWDALKGLIASFFHHGAKVASLMGRHSGIEYSWLHYTIRQLRSQFTILGGLEPASIFEIFLKNGLDPNSGFGRSTIWEHLLGALGHGLQYAHSRNYVEMSCKLILLFLSYGADPSSETLFQMMGWTFGGSCRFEQFDARAIELAVRREMDELQSRNGLAACFHGPLNQPPEQPLSHPPAAPLGSVPIGELREQHLQTLHHAPLRRGGTQRNSHVRNDTFAFGSKRPFPFSDSESWDDDRGSGYNSIKRRAQ